MDPYAEIIMPEDGVLCLGDSGSITRFPNGTASTLVGVFHAIGGTTTYDPRAGGGVGTCVSRRNPTNGALISGATASGWYSRYWAFRNYYANLAPVGSRFLLKPVGT